MKRIAWSILAAVVLSGSAGGQDALESARKAVFLEQEYAIAKTSASYFIFDFKTRVIVLKAKGFKLKEWPMGEIRAWGRPAALKAYTLVKKSAIHQPARRNITPGAGDAPKDVELDVLEIGKMPVRYALQLTDETRIRIRPAAKGWRAVPNRIGRFFSWTMAQSFKTVWRAVWNKPYTGIEIVLPAEYDAKGVYWSFFEGQKCILYF